MGLEEIIQDAVDAAVKLGQEYTENKWQAKYASLKAVNEKLAEEAERAYAAIEMLVPDKFIGLLQLPNGKVYDHRAFWESLYLEKHKQALAEAK